MKGLMRRDFLLLAPMLGLFSLAAAAMSVFSIAAVSSIWSPFLLVFCVSVLLTPFSYDGQNHWMSYAAALPEGRRAAVTARYTLILLLDGAALALLLVTGIVVALRGSAVILLAMPLYAGVLLLSTAGLPLALYKLSGAKGQFAALAVVVAMTLALMAGGMILETTKNDPASGSGPGVWMPILGFVLLALGVVSMRASWKSSLKTVERQDL